MIVIDPNAIYNHDDLKQMFHKVGVDWDRLAAQMRPRKIYRAWFGRHILDALAAFGEIEKDPAVLVEPAMSTPKPSRRGRRRSKLLEIAMREVGDLP